MTTMPTTAIKPPDDSILICLHRGSGVIASLIEWQTRGAYSHASIILPDGRHIEAREFKGVVIHDAFSPNPGDFVSFFRVDGSPAEFAAIAAKALEEVGAKYDYATVFDFITRGRPARESETKWFCSELAFALLHFAGIDLFRATEAWEVSPALLARSPLLIPFDARSY